MDLVAGDAGFGGQAGDGALSEGRVSPEAAHRLQGIQASLSIPVRRKTILLDRGHHGTRRRDGFGHAPMVALHRWPGNQVGHESPGGARTPSVTTLKASKMSLCRLAGGGVTRSQRPRASAPRLRRVRQRARACSEVWLRGMQERRTVVSACWLIWAVVGLTDPVATREIACLRREAEMGPVSRLGCVARRALELTDELCRDSLRRGDVLTFVRQCACGAELREFCLCAQLADV
ncbi:hypothetical protein ABT404_32120 [Streptomyces hyaluromycini]|uniref:Transposase n=1 Tax=Streptomyces hyaluromycini TaxID=1377993 RepID=A0ABV1X4X3_9ACTN